MPLLDEVFFQAAEQHADRVAWDTPEGTLTYRAFGDQVRQTAGALQDLGVRRGDRVAILAPNCPEYLAYHYGTAALGAILVVLNTRWVEPELVYAINRATACALLVHPNCGAALETLTSQCSSLRFTVDLGSRLKTTHRHTDLIAADRDVVPTSDRDESLPAVLMYTSGTTGRPKGALQTHAGSSRSDRLTADLIALQEDDVFLAFMPYFHQAGLVRSRATLISGACNVVAAEINPQTLGDFLLEKGVTFTMLVPPYDSALRREVLEDKRAFPKLRFLLGGGGMGERHTHTIAAFCAQTGCRYLGVYGQTEVTGVASTLYDDECLARPTSCGRPSRDMAIEIRDDAGNSVPTGEVGEIMVRSERCIPGYWDDPEASSALYSGEWLHTGDLGRFDADGYLYIAGRKKELIKSGGENVYPREVEEVLLSVPNVREAVVLGTPDPQWGEAVTAAVVARDGETVTLEQIRDYCRDRIAGYKIPKKAICLDQLPRNHTGKPIKSAILDLMKDAGAR